VGVTINVTNIPSELKRLPNWVLCKAEKRDNKLTKIPYSVNGSKAKSNDPTTWSPFQPILNKVGNGYAGIGFEFALKDGIIGIDFDGCRDPETGDVDLDILEWIRRLNSYAEVSISGTGLHVFVKATIPGERRRKGDIEIYDSGRFFVVTGERFKDSSLRIEERQKELTAFYNAVFGDEENSTEKAQQAVAGHILNPTLQDKEIIRKAAAAKNGDKFKRLFFDGDTSGYRSQSEAELALCNLLHFQAGDNPAQIDRLVRQSALMRTKWAEKRGAQTYGDMTLNKAIEGGATWSSYAFSRNVAAKIQNDIDAANAIITVNGREKQINLPPIPVQRFEVVERPKKIEDLLEVFRSRLYIEEDYAVIGPVCAFLANFLPHEPDIIGIVAPSGSIKTEIIRSFGEKQNAYCYPISSVTEHTFASGLEKNIDTIPLLRGRVITIKDLTTLLSKKEDIRSAVFADFREITDGYLHKEFGNGVKKEFHNIHSTILFASTPAIERYYSMYSNLGARMVFLRPQNDPIKARQKSRENQPKIKQIRKELQEAMLSYIDLQIKRLSNEPLPEIPSAMAEEIGQYCDLLAWIRHPIHHDFRGNIDEIPDPEFPTRLVNTITKLTQVHAFVYRRDSTNEDDLAFARRIVADNIPTARAAVLSRMNGEWISTSELSDISGIAPAMLRYRLEELVSLTVCERKGRESSTEGTESTKDTEGGKRDGRSNHYRVSQKWLSTLVIMKDVIRIGGRKEENNSSNYKKSVELEEIHKYHQNLTPHFSDSLHDNNEPSCSKTPPATSLEAGYEREGGAP
jgi:hypothetical protein